MRQTTLKALHIHNNVDMEHTKAYFLKLERLLRALAIFVLIRSWPQ